MLTVVDISDEHMSFIRVIALTIWFTTGHLTHFLGHCKPSGILVKQIELNNVVFEMPM